MAVNARGQGALLWQTGALAIDDRSMASIRRFSLRDGVRGPASPIGKVDGLGGIAVARDGAAAAWGTVAYTSDRTWMAESDDGFRRRATGGRQLARLIPTPGGGLTAITWALGRNRTGHVGSCRAANGVLDRCRRFAGDWEDRFFEVSWDSSLDWRRDRLVLTAGADDDAPTLMSISPTTGRSTAVSLPLSGAREGYSDALGNSIAVAMPGIDESANERMAIGVGDAPQTLRTVTIAPEPADDPLYPREFRQADVVVAPGGGAFAVWVEQDMFDQGALRWAELDARGHLRRLGTLDTGNLFSLRLQRAGGRTVIAWEVLGLHHSTLRSAVWTGGDPRRITFGDHADEMRGELLDLAASSAGAALAWRSASQQLRLSFLR